MLNSSNHYILLHVFNSTDVLNTKKKYGEEDFKEIDITSYFRSVYFDRKSIDIVLSKLQDMVMHTHH